MLMVGLFAAVAFLLAGVNEAHAQSDQQAGDLFVIPAAAWVTNAQANALLTNHIDAVKAELDDLTPGTPAYQAKLKEGIFFRDVLRDLVANEVVPDAILFALQPLAVSTAAHYATVADKLALKDQAIDMLSN